jgi:hypothetical protein
MAKKAKKPPRSSKQLRAGSQSYFALCRRRLYPCSGRSHLNFTRLSSLKDLQDSMIARVRTIVATRWIMQFEPRVRYAAQDRVVQYGRRFVRAVEFGLTDCADLLHAGTS